MVDVVPFAAHNCFKVNHNVDFEDLVVENENLVILLSPEGYKEEEYCDNPKELKVNGWEWIGYATCGKNMRLYGDHWKRKIYSNVFKRF